MKQGYMALSAILLISIIVLSISTTVALISIGEGQSSISHTQGEGVLRIVESCAEDALWRIRANAGYSASVITTPLGSCTVSITGAGNPKTLTVSSQDMGHARSIQVVYNRTAAGVVIVSWREQ